MRILAADTSTASCSIALLDGDRILLEWVLVASQTHNRRLLRSVEDALRAVGWDFGDVDAFAVTVGP
ncbi:MAG: tRNA (adenosine(37)-N6)-threonylcarbamoyltransferase complex dimerization subunit type 1 TsaB, partial [Syntrophobacteraceae bacterium]|nr:tRNA (adenosine(37)-N6)-threonylcarbamoyltransferase complex dimerization subunit type 1 TsaB [Syntrophobacteraceae bacterium]